ncbi:MAG: molybdopterin biosynthesis protein [Syntrophobacterales bacterium]|nr:molybdopterin biosynthesis protein [Syntrophobacterales bacterium]
MKRKIYLNMRTLEEARNIWANAFRDIRASSEEIKTTEALGRVTAEPVFARRSVPHYHGAAMDGIAVDASKTFGATETSPTRLRIGVDAFHVNTGDPLPEGTNAVIMIEHVFPLEDRDDVVEIRSAAYPWQHVRKVGEDIVSGELIIPVNHILRPADLGALLAAFVNSVRVYRRPRVWIQPTGDELVSPDQAESIKPGQIVEFNGTILASLVKTCQGEPILRNIVPDRADAIRESLLEACRLGVDLVLINAGSSAGSEDYTVHIINELGTVFVHGVTMMPGKPVILGEIMGKPVVGVPGYPVSAIIAFEQFVKPLLWQLQGLHPPESPRVSAVLARKVVSKLGLEEFLRVVLGKVGGQLVAVPIQRGAGLITSLTRADGIVRIPHDEEGIDAGKTISVELLKAEDAIEHNLIMIGSHDNTIDIIASELKARDSRLHLSSSNVGSLGGLIALRKGHAHIAGSHLLDVDDGSYNFSFVEKYLRGVSVRIVELTKRQQGLMLAPGNPKNIKSIADLVRPDIRFINRQAGAGTRILFDYELKKAGISPDQIAGYDQEEYTHMAVAVAILSGRVDVGMGIYAAAKALGLDFIPISDERYDLVIREDVFNERKVRLLVEVIGSDRFRKMVKELGGYDPSLSGAIIGIWNGEKWEKRI